MHRRVDNRRVSGDHRLGVNRRSVNGVIDRLRVSGCLDSGVVARKDRLGVNRSRVHECVNRFGVNRSHVARVVASRVRVHRR